MNKSSSITWVGLDAHSKSIHVAVVRDADIVREFEVANEQKSVRRLARQLCREAPGEVRCYYEAGPCGFVLKRQLEEAGPLICEVIAPSMIPRRPGDRIKTDRRDARRLAELLSANLLTACCPIFGSSSYAALRA